MNLKSTKFLLLLMLSLTLAGTTSCKKEEKEENNNTENNDDNNNGDVEDSFFAKIDGSSFNPNIIIVNTFQGNIQLQGTGNNSEGIQLIFPTSIEEGSYTFEGDFGARRGLYTEPGGQAGENNLRTAAIGTGSLVIETNNTSNKVVKGTFSFTATPSQGSSATGSVEITEGAFEVNY